MGNRPVGHHSSGATRHEKGGSRYFHTRQSAGNPRRQALRGRPRGQVVPPHGAGIWALREDYSSAAGYRRYLRFLYHIGERSLPVAFIRIAQALQRGNAPEMLVKSNTVFMLGVLLQRHVYGRPVELKQDQALRDAVLLLLDILVESGSSAAFRMRDDFVTPA